MATPRTLLPRQGQGQVRTRCSAPSLWVSKFLCQLPTSAQCVWIPTHDESRPGSQVILSRALSSRSSGSSIVDAAEAKHNRAGPTFVGSIDRTQPVSLSTINSRSTTEGGPQDRRVGDQRKPSPTPGGTNQQHEGRRSTHLLFSSVVPTTAHDQHGYGSLAVGRSTCCLQLQQLDGQHLFVRSVIAARTAATSQPAGKSASSVSWGVVDPIHTDVGLKSIIVVVIIISLAAQYLDVGCELCHTGRVVAWRRGSR